MNHIEFMKELESLLQGISKEERDEALLFYQNYFDDAGTENEDDIIRELESPRKVADTILADLKGTEYTEQGVKGADEEQKDTPTVRGETVKQGPKTSTALKIVLVILIGLAAITFAGPLVLGALCIVFGLVCAAFGIFIGLVVGAAAMMIGGVALVILGLTKIFSVFPIALATSGAGLILFIVGLIAMVGCVKLCMIAFPAMVRGIVYVCRLPFQRKAVS
ncbi:MAG: DUF1700 domain-containing protein [Hespellia sp.]|nr:DUF1700 domain-containing protein [Hespellia sp.]